MIDTVGTVAGGAIRALAREVRASGSSQKISRSVERTTPLHFPEAHREEVRGDDPEVLDPRALVVMARTPRFIVSMRFVMSMRVASNSSSDRRQAGARFDVAARPRRVVLTPWSQLLGTGDGILLLL